MATKAAETPVATPLEEIGKRPDSITLFGNIIDVLNEMSIYARNGYKPFAGVSPHYFAETATMSILLQLGDPLPLVHQRAKESIAREAAKEAAEFTRRVNEEAARRVAAQVQADQDARIEAAEAVAAAAVAKIKADVAAERARIEANL